MLNLFSESDNSASANQRLLWFILAIAALLRLSGLTAFSLSNDELSALARLQYDSVAAVISEGVYPDFHPAGVQLFLLYWTKLFGFGEWTVRLPFALMGIGSVYMIYKTGRLWFGEPTALMAAAALAVLEYPLLYSQLARPYSPGLFFSLVAVYFWTLILFKNTGVNRNRSLMNYAGFVIAISCCMYIHYFSFIIAGIFCFSGIFFLNRKTFFPYLVSGALILILYLPHLGVFLHQLSKGGVGGAEGWLGPPRSDAFTKYLDFCFNDSYQLKLLFLVILMGTAFIYKREIQLNRFHLLSVIFFLMPFGIAYYYSIYRNPVFQYSVLLFSFPYLLLLLFSFIPKTTGKFTLFLIVLCILSGGVYSTVIENKYYSKQHFTEFRHIGKRVKEFDEKLGAENITRSINVFNPYYINYYLEYYDHPVKFSSYRLLSDDDRKHFRKLVEQSQTPYFLHAYSNMGDDPQIDMFIRSRYPWIIARDSMLGSGLRLYSKSRSDSALNLLPVITLDNGFENGSWQNESVFRDSVKKAEGNYSVRISPNQEYGPGLDVDFGSSGLSAGDVIEANALFYCDNIPKGVNLVLSIEKGDEKYFYTAVSADESDPEPGSWNRVFIKGTVPGNIPADARLKIYCWNSQKLLLYIDDFRMSVYSGRR